MCSLWYPRTLDPVTSRRYIRKRFKKLPELVFLVEKKRLRHRGRVARFPAMSTEFPSPLSDARAAYQGALQPSRHEWCD